MGLRREVRYLFFFVLALTLALTLAPTVAPQPAVAAGESGFLTSPTLPSPGEIGRADSVDGLGFGDPTAEVDVIAPPTPDASGAAKLSYPLDLPGGRGMSSASVPALALTYNSGGRGGWVGQGWSLGAGEVTVDTTFGVPRFCPSAGPGPACGNVESEAYRLNGDLLWPNASVLDTPRIADRGDYVRKVEDTYERTIRRGNRPDNYTWEVRDKEGNVFFYGGYPDRGGDVDSPGKIGTRVGAATNDLSVARDAILADDQGNGFTWYLKAQRDIYANLVRYEYETVYYKARPTAQGTEWDTVEKSACTATVTCARHVYLKGIAYGGRTESATGQAGKELPSYYVLFKHSRRPGDPVLDARGGFLDLDAQQLDSIEIHLTNDGANGLPRSTHPLYIGPIMKKYDLKYDAGEFGKTFLTSVTRTGCAQTQACDPTTAQTTSLRYHDKIVGSGGFAPPVTWHTGDDDKEDLGLASTIGMSTSNGGGGKLYVGFNPALGTKTGSFGVGVAVDGGETRSQIELMDINGDGLPDKVYQEGRGISFRLNTAQPTDPLDKQVTFSSDEHRVEGITTLSSDSNVGVRGSLEAHFGVEGNISLGGGWTWSNAYFTDVNADGLPDLVRGETVLFNKLSCPAGEICTPTFSTDPAGTRVPIDVNSDAPAQARADQQEVYDQATKAVPVVDTVRRWIAPYTGTIQIADMEPFVTPGAPVATCEASTGMIVSVQKEGAWLNRCALGVPSGKHNKVLSVGVQKGERIYFRLQPDPDVPASTVYRTQTITYTSIPGAGSTSPLNPDGKSQTVFNNNSDFSSTGRSGAIAQFPEAGPVEFEVEIIKQPSSDDLTPVLAHDSGLPGMSPVDRSLEVQPITATGAADASRVREVVHSPDAGYGWCVKVGEKTVTCGFSSEAAATEALNTTLFGPDAGRFRVSGSVTIDNPAQVPGVASDRVPDTVSAVMRSTSPIDPRDVQWVTVPGYCVAEPVCVPTDDRYEVSMDIETYASLKSGTPQERFTPPAKTGTIYDFALTYVQAAAVAAQAGPDADIWLTLKADDGTVVRKRFSAGTQAGAYWYDARLKLDPAKTYWVDVSVRSSAVFKAMSNVQLRVEDRFGTLVAVSHHVNGQPEPDVFTGGYRGWSVIGYRGGDARRGMPIDQSLLTLSPPGTPSGTKYAGSGAACEALFGKTQCDSKSTGTVGKLDPDEPFDASALPGKEQNVYVFNQKLTPGPDGTAADDRLVGPREEIYAQGLASGAARVADVAALGDAPGSPGGTMWAPQRLGVGAPQVGLSGGAFGMGASFNLGVNMSEKAFMDMNGDSFPDAVNGDWTLYSDPRGGRRCVDVDGSAGSCMGSGVGDLTNFGFAVSVGGNLNGGVGQSSVNSIGSGNSTKGDSTAKSSAADRDASYGGFLGLGGGVSGTWTNPVVSLSDWTLNKGDFDFAQGDMFDTDSQMALADVNGDGLPDRVRVDQSGVWVRFGLGYRFSATWVPWARSLAYEQSESVSGSLNAFGIGGFATPMVEFSGGASTSASTNFARWTWNDVNGDGLLDALHKDTDAGVKIRFGTGTGLAPATRFGTAATRQGSFGLTGASFGINPPGGEQIRQDSSVSAGGGGDFSFGIPLCVAACYLVIGVGGQGSHSVTVSDVDLKDVNGDGLLDSLQRPTTENADDAMQVRLNTQGETGLLERVLALMARGLSNAAIARELHIREKSVVRHVSHVYDALGLQETPDAHRRVQAVVQHLWS